MRGFPVEKDLLNSLPSCLSPNLPNLYSIAIHMLTFHLLISIQRSQVTRLKVYLKVWLMSLSLKKEFLEVCKIIEMFGSKGLESVCLVSQ